MRTALGGFLIRAFAWPPVFRVNLPVALLGGGAIEGGREGFATTLPVALLAGGACAVIAFIAFIAFIGFIGVERRRSAARFIASDPRLLMAGGLP